MVNHFANCHSSEDVKKRYRELCKEFHPDLHQDEKEKYTVLMQEINAAYAQVSAQFRYDEMREKARQYNRPEPTAQDYTDAAAVDETIRAAIERIITLEGLEIEICGLWVWVGGNTREHHCALKDAKYRWATKKEKWYFAGVPAGKSRGMDMDDIRNRYGSQRVLTRRQNSRYAPATVQEGKEA